VTENRHDHGLVEDATERLDRAASADDAARVELLDDLYASLERELEAEQAPAPGR
jgi:hypothetical protein